MKGFKNVKTSEIAELAEIGEGTLFNYFKSKSELFIAALFEDVSYADYTIHTEGIETEEQVIDEIMRVIEYYVKNAKTIDRSLLREYLSIVYDTTNSESHIARQSQIDADRVIADNLEDLLASLVRNNKVDAGFDVQTAVRCIYGCSITVFNEFVYSDTMPYDSMIQDIRRQVEFMLVGKMMGRRTDITDERLKR